jgi:hypothetical protein
MIGASSLMSSHTLPASTSDKNKFASVVRHFIVELEKEPGMSHEMPTLQKRYKIKRRRLYDVTNILTAIGCTEQNGPDGITWLGIDRILPRLVEQKQQSGIANYQLSLEELFPQSNCVGLASLTVSLLLMFPAIGTKVLNLRDVSAFFSRDSQRYKTTLCKLYQITLILGALEITERTENACEVRLRDPFMSIVEGKVQEYPFAIETLLNRENELERRKAEFRQICDKYEHLAAERPTATDRKVPAPEETWED